jgi:hypothetical protein
MGFPLFRVTLSNDIEGSLVISEPGGWDDAKLKLERNEKFHSLVELYDQPLTFYGQDISENGGIEFIRNIEQTQGIDAQIGILIEVSYDEGDTYETVVTNTLSVDTAKETDFYKLEMGVIRNGFWQNFMNRLTTPVDLLSPIDLDGGSRDVISQVTVQMSSQTVRETLRGSIAEPFRYRVSTNIEFFQINNSLDEISEIKVKYNLPSETVSSLVNLFEAELNGVYNFDIQFELTESPSVGDIGISIPTDLEFYIRKNEDTPSIFSKTNFTNGGTRSNPGFTRFTYSGSLNLVKGDFIYIYGDLVNNLNSTIVWGTDLSDYPGNPTHNFIVTFPTSAQGSFIRCLADTLYDDTETEGFLIHEAGNAITDRIICRDQTFYSEYLGNQNSQIVTYDDHGCGSNYALTRGLNIRGYSLADKPFFIDFQKYWDGINPLFNLGLGYETLPDSPELEVIRIEPKSYFYDKTQMSVTFDFVNNIERSYDVDSIFKAIEIGFNKWSAESVSGVDDPQTKHVYNTRFKTVGKEIKILSKFIGASLAIEQTRRNRVEQGKDWRLDEDVMIIAINPDVSPEYQPELDENFSDVTGLLNADTRYNIRLSVARNFERWKNYFNGCLQWYVNLSPEEDYKFASGEGNFDMVTTLDETDCEGGGVSPEPALSEKQNIAVTDDFLFMPIQYSFEHPLTWDEYKTIRDNRNLAIGVSRSNTGHKACFIQSLEYQITRGKGIFTVLLGENDPL